MFLLVTHTEPLDRVLKLDDDWHLLEDVRILEKKIGDIVSLECFHDGIMDVFIVRIFKSQEETG